MLRNRLFFALASRSGFEATISDAVARSSIVFSNSVSADRIVVAASRLLPALAVCVIKGSLGGETSVLRTFRMSGKELVKERVSQGKVS